MSALARIEAYEAADAARQARTDRAELEALRNYAFKATKAITGLVGGGSEMFAGRIGQMFKADLTYCVERLRERSQMAHRNVVDAILSEKKARRQADALIEAAKQAAVVLGQLPDTKATTDAYAALTAALSEISSARSAA